MQEARTWAYSSRELRGARGRAAGHSGDQACHLSQAAESSTRTRPPDGKRFSRGRPSSTERCPQRPGPGTFWMSCPCPRGSAGPGGSKHRLPGVLVSLGQLPRLARCTGGSGGRSPPRRHPPASPTHLPQSTPQGAFLYPFASSPILWASPAPESGRLEHGAPLARMSPSRSSTSTQAGGESSVP